MLSTCVQIVDGVQHVHDSGYVHSDIKPENCLKGSDGQVKLCDFGGAAPISVGSWGCVAFPATQHAHALIPLQQARRWSAELCSQQSFSQTCYDPTVPFLLQMGAFRWVQSVKITHESFQALIDLCSLERLKFVFLIDSPLSPIHNFARCSQRRKLTSAL